jgi:hypothetical protein
MTKRRVFRITHTWVILWGVRWNYWTIEVIHPDYIDGFWGLGLEHRVWLYTAVDRITAISLVKAPSKTAIVKLWLVSFIRSIRKNVDLISGVRVVVGRVFPFLQFQSIRINGQKSAP